MTYLIYRAYTTGCPPGSGLPQEYSFHVNVNWMVSPTDTLLALVRALFNNAPKDETKDDGKCIQILPYQSQTGCGAYAKNSAAGKRRVNC